MELSRWMEYYDKIVEDFRYDKETDKRAARLLSELGASSRIAPLDELKGLINGKTVFICGDAPTLEKDLDKKLDVELDIPSKEIFIAADNATSTLMDNLILPQLITTDLDGDVGRQVEANQAGAIVVVHAHGDNMDMLERWMPKFRGKLVLHTQTKPFDNVYNFGGFTDGDRAVLLAEHFGAEKIELLGFDFEHPRIKEGGSTDVKLKKLEWAKRLIDEVILR